MSPDALQAAQTVTRLAEELQFRQSDAEKYDSYYRTGRGRLLAFASKQFAEYFDQRYTKFSDNWCGVVADAPTERLEVTGFRPLGADQADDETWRVWRENDADHFSDQAFLEAILAKRSFVLVWGNPADDETPRVTFEHPRQAIVAYDPETNERRAGLKLWVDEHNEREHSTLYTPEAVWKWQRQRIQGGRTDSGLYVPASDVGGWEPRQPSTDDTWPVPNPMGKVPLVELPNRPRLIGEPISDIAGVAAMQDAINLIWSYLLNDADFTSLPQRVVLGADRPKVPVLDENGQVVGEKDVPLQKFRNDRIVWLENPEAKIDQWSAANLQMYTGVLEVCVAHVAAQSRTPPHYLMSRIVNANADTLKTAETGLVKRSEEKTESFGRGIRHGAELIALAQENPAKAKALRAGKVLWRDVEIRSEAQAMDAALKARQVGYPLEYISRRWLGMPPDEVAEVLRMIEREAEIDPIGALARQPLPAPMPAPEPTGE
jgi:hypothetical protein